jgi:hypothetical protein
VSTIACASAQASSTSLNCFLNMSTFALGVRVPKMTRHTVGE